MPTVNCAVDLRGLPGRALRAQFDGHLDRIVDQDIPELGHLHRLRSQLGEEFLDAVVVTTGRHAYRRTDGVAVVPAGPLDRVGVGFHGVGGQVDLGRSGEK